MTAYRLAAARRYPPDNSEGARRVGGRWNPVGVPVIYAASTRALAAAELFAHHGGIPLDYDVITIEFPDDLPVETVELSRLPPGWPEGVPNDPTAEIGRQWAQSGRTAILRVPSAVFPSEWNYVLNPLHPDFHRIEFGVSNAEYIDPRLRTPAL